MASPLAPAAASAIAPPAREAVRTRRPWYLQAILIATVGKVRPGDDLPRETETDRKTQATLPR